MRRIFGLVALAVSLAACAAPQTIISNKKQAVIDASSHAEAVRLATKECGRFDRWPYLQRHDGSDYWFACNESEEAVVQRIKDAQEAAMKRAEELRKAETKTPATAPAVPGSPTSSAAPSSPNANASPTPLTAAADKERSSAEKSPADTAKGNWVQLGVFRDKSVAKNYVATIRKAHSKVINGHEVMLSEIQGRRGTLHLARLGPYQKAAEARRACAQLKSGGADCLVAAAR